MSKPFFYGYRIRLETTSGDHVYSTDLLSNFDWNNSRTTDFLVKEMRRAVRRYPKRVAMLGRSTSTEGTN